jgi:putative membrane protein
MKPRNPLVGLAVAAAAASLALSACHRNTDGTAASTDTTTTASTSPPTNTAAPGNETTPAGSGIKPSSNMSSGTVDSSASPGAMVANSPTAAVAPSGTPLTGFDKTFATNAAEGGMFEVEVGKLAKDKASDPAVKDFGQKLVDDHSAANDKLRQIATSHNLALPASLPADKQKELDKLAKLSGKAFDKAFVQMVGMKDHKHDIAQFEKASREAKADDLRAFAKDALPTLHQHLSTASKLPGHA